MIVEADPSQTTTQLAAGFGVSDKIILFRLKQIGNVTSSRNGYRLNWLKHTNKHALSAALHY